MRRVTSPQETSHEPFDELARYGLSQGKSERAFGCPVSREFFLECFISYGYRVEADVMLPRREVLHTPNSGSLYGSLMWPTRLA